MQLNDLPFDIVRLILCLLPQPNLSTVSRVCRVWRNAILPILFKVVYLSKNNPNTFIRQTLDGTNDAIPQSTKSKLSNYVQQLSIHWRMNKQELGDFALALQKLENLKHITWEVAPFPWMGWDNTIGILHRKSPGLQSLRLIIDQDVDAISFNIGCENLPFQTDEVGSEPSGSDKIVALINLPTLSIEFRQPSHKRTVPQEIIFLICDYFPNLRSIQIKSSNLAKVGGFGGQELRRFIKNHNHLEELAISPTRHVRAPTNVETIISQDVERLMPSIRHFAGTSPSVNALLGSRLARQLEVLEIIVYPRDLLEMGGSELPCLRKLRLRTHYPARSNIEWKTIWDVLGDLTPRSLVLRELSIEAYSLWREEYTSDNLVTNSTAYVEPAT
ncbi:F-box-like protein [Rhizoctonia solani 123E]|uniref:F-box-like protein n=1 Tax=Rhizoctonia solani 123E TaxID=1423351 RepID=A0A074S4W2_9AGAM|nr:F-box-like protein [Rhizoctonia solani 123E]